MRVEVDEDGELVFSEVYSGIGIKTDVGLFGIAQRDGGIEVMLNGRTVWTSNELATAKGCREEFHEDGTLCIDEYCEIPIHRIVRKEGAC
jgi:hypothetical protein